MTVVPDTGSRLDRLLAGSVTSRLHLGLVLVARLKADPVAVLDLVWDDVDLVANRLTCGGQVLVFDDVVAGLFYWHAVRQRLDRLQAPRWADTGRVFVNRHGAPITGVQADAILSWCCRLCDLPVVPLAGLRHPVWGRS